MASSKADLIVGIQWGDEGKGKIVDVLTKKYDIIARFQGGPNAGHTLEFDGIKHVLHTIPSGIFHDRAINIVGNGVVIDPVIFKKEIDNLSSYNIDFKTKQVPIKEGTLSVPMIVETACVGIRISPEGTCINPPPPTTAST